uniref:FYVE, RhoGEF and PH domain containing 6 n=1 Tax=Ictidomys tridecemlineatus TaxID=43179 RepID=I3MRF9_ICTTR
ETEAAKIKKPPVAPKPKFVVANNKPSPPPVAPKPDIVIASGPQSTKKTKPAIAPKPKVLKSSPVRDIGQSSSGTISVNLEEHKLELPESTDNFNCKNVEDQSSDYILPICSCRSECVHKLGNREDSYVKQLVLEPLEMKENLQNSKIDESSLTVKTKSRWDSRGEKHKNQSGVVLKASILEGKLKDVLTQQMSPVSSLKKHRSTDNPERNGGCNSNRQFRIELADLSPSLSSFVKLPVHHNCQVQLPRDEFQSPETCQDSSEKSNTLENGKRNTFISSDGVSKKTEVEDLGPLEIHLVPCTPRFPTPKPRKTRPARLLRQKYIDTPSESTEEPENFNNSSSCLIEDSLKNNKVSILHQDALCNQEQVDKVKPGNNSELNSNSNDDSQDLVNSEAMLAPSLDTDSNLSSDGTSVDGASMALATDQGTSFIRCSTLSLSLPKQLKLTYNEHLPTACNLEVSIPQMQKESIVKEESSSKIVPRKPQRHSLPAAGVLKKAASEELVEKSSYPSNEEKNSEKVLERNHLCASNHGMSSPFDMPKRTSEKPVWKLPHPILPFLGNPESLKSVTTSSHSEPPTALTKPRAKSLSAVDMDRCTKPCKDSPKKTSLKKWLNMKLSISFMKSDFQKFWSKSSQLGETHTGSCGEQKGTESDWHDLMVGEEKRSKPIKAYSADNYSLESQKKRKKSRGQTSTANGLRAESLDDQMLSKESLTNSCAPEYENIRHYEEIPEYENLPFIMAVGKTRELEWQDSCSGEETDANVYEVEEPYEAPDGQWQLGPRHQPLFSEDSGKGNLGLGCSGAPGFPQLLSRQNDEDAGIKSKVHHIAKEIMSSEKVLLFRGLLFSSLAHLKHFFIAVFCFVLFCFADFPRCANLALKHYLLKPVQRIPQYRLLLTDYLKNLLEDSGDYRDTQDALAVVIEVANHANDTMKQGDNFQKLMQIQYSLNGHHEIVQPGRVFLKEGILKKLSRKVMQPRMFFLFNDALLYTTPVQSGMYKLNNMLSLAGMKVRKPTQEAYQNELKIESVERSFILSASSATERDEWLEAISRSIEEYAKKRTTFCPSRSLEEADSENKDEVSPLGSKAPIWIPDTRATMCMICTSEFTLTWRRHHCRACGKIVCQACSSNKYGLDYLKNQPARVCEHCFQELQKLDRQHSPKVGSPGNHKSPSSALSSVLHSIPSGRKQKKIPAALKEVSANTEDSSMSGYLYRSKGNKKPWKHLWFVIKNKVLYTYAASEDVAALESQPLLGFTVTQVKDENSESKVFQLLHKNMLFYVFKADDAHSAQKWIEAFQEGTIL